MAKLIKLDTPRSKETYLKQLRQTRERLADNEFELWKVDIVGFLIRRLSK